MPRACIELEHGVPGALFMQGNSTMLKVWGRANSVNVQKVVWCCDELQLSYKRIDAGLEYGVNTEPEYLAKNPNGRIPMLEDGDFSLWESNAILRYLVMQYQGERKLYPLPPATRASIDRWLDWSLSTLQPAERPVFWAVVRTAPAARDEAALARDVAQVARHWAILDAQLAGRRFIENDAFSLADLVLGAYARRWFGLDGIERPHLPHLASWYERIEARTAFQRHVAQPLT
jgi:glutathione S-transferase